MKLHAGTNVIEKSGNFEESKFSIEASSKAFFILSDGLYSNKILAVVRELSTNAYDSHVDAGKANIPFDVHLPTAITPVFFIRDYGTSMDHDSCMQLYTTYFRSTRNNSNDAVGCLGLGSKAPFAYADSFTVEAYLDGTKRVYNAYKNEDGSPVFSLMDESATDEKNGIKVSIQVNSNDVNKFYHEAQKVYEFFKVRPNFIGQKLEFKKVTQILAGSNWYFSDAHDNLIIMGQIAYPFDHYQLMGDGDNREAKFVSNSTGLRIFVNIGDVDITPSRESLSYSKETKANIKRIINTITSEIAEKIEDQIKSQPNLYKARIKYVQISDQCDSIKCAIDALQKSLKWNDTPLFDNIVTESVSIKNKISVVLMDKSQYRKKINTNKDVETIGFKSTIKFYVDDLTRGGNSRIKQQMRENYGSQICYVYKLIDGETVDNCKLYDIMGGASKDDVILTSSLPKIQYDRSSSGSSDGGPAVHIRVFNEETGHFEDCTMSVKYENAYYFIEAKDNVKIGHKEVDIGNVEAALAYAHEYYSDDIDGMTFYAVKPSVAKNRNLEGRDNWHNAVTVMESIIGKAIKAHKEDIIEYHRRVNLSTNHNSRWKEVFEVTETDNEVKRVVAEYNEYMSNRNTKATCLVTIQHLAEMFPNVESVNFSGIKLDDDRFSKRFDNEMKKYPMLQVCNVPWRDTDKKIIADYIDMIERSTNMSNVFSSL